MPNKATSDQNMRSITYFTVNAFKLCCHGAVSHTTVLSAPGVGWAQCPGFAAVAVLVPCAAKLSVFDVAMSSPAMSDHEHAVISSPAL